LIAHDAFADWGWRIVLSVAADARLDGHFERDAVVREHSHAMPNVTRVLTIPRSPRLTFTSHKRRERQPREPQC